MSFLGGFGAFALACFSLLFILFQFPPKASCRSLLTLFVCVLRMEIPFPIARCSPSPCGSVRHLLHFRSTNSRSGKRLPPSTVVGTEVSYRAKIMFTHQWTAGSALSCSFIFCFHFLETHCFLCCSWAGQRFGQLHC